MSKQTFAQVALALAIVNLAVGPASTPFIVLCAVAVVILTVRQIARTTE